MMPDGDLSRLAMPLPQAHDAEQAVLGALLIDNTGRAWTAVEGVIRARDFAYLPHQALFRHIATETANGRPCDPIALGPVAKSDPALADAGGARWLMQLAEAAQSIVNVAGYARLVRDCRQRRDAIAAIDQARGRLFDVGDDDAQSIIMSCVAGLEQMAIENCNGVATAAQFSRKAVKWLWHPYLPGGQISIVAGRGGSGKGLIGADLASRVTRGCAWPLGDEKAPLGNVLWGEAEDPTEEVLIPRLTTAGADLERVYIQKPADFIKTPLRHFIHKNDVRAIILSPLISFLKSLEDINGELGVRQALENLFNAVDGTDCAVVGLAHLNKATDLDAVERILGSVAFTNFCRSVLLVRRDDEQFRLVHGKFNLSRRGADLLYSVTHDGPDERDQSIRINWSRAEENVDADRFLDRTTKKHGDADGRPSARQWLLDYLLEHGESPRSHVIKAATAAGYSEETIRKAHQREPRCDYRREGFQGEYVWWAQ